jgi:hypothetical protein
MQLGKNRFWQGLIEIPFSSGFEIDGFPRFLFPSRGAVADRAILLEWRVIFYDFY